MKVIKVSVTGFDVTTLVKQDDGQFVAVVISMADFLEGRMTAINYMQLGDDLQDLTEAEKDERTAVAPIITVSIPGFGMRPAELN